MSFDIFYIWIRFLSELNNSLSLIFFYVCSKIQELEAFSTKAYKKAPFLFLKEGVEEIEVTKACDSPRQTTTIQSTPLYLEREHPLPCLTDVYPEVAVLVTSLVKGCYKTLNFSMSFTLFGYLALQIYKKKEKRREENREKFASERQKNGAKNDIMRK